MVLKYNMPKIRYLVWIFKYNVPKIHIYKQNIHDKSPSVRDFIKLNLVIARFDKVKS